MNFYRIFKNLVIHIAYAYKNEFNTNGFFDKFDMFLIFQNFEKFDSSYSICQRKSKLTLPNFFINPISFVVLRHVKKMIKK